MKKIISILLAAVLTATLCTSAAAARGSLSLRISPDNERYAISDDLYGVFIEDISYACDGGLVSNLINNNSFEYESDRLANWKFSALSASVQTESAMNANNPTYCLVQAQAGGVLTNIGYPEYYDYMSYDVNVASAETPDMGFRAGERYRFSCYVKGLAYNSSITVYLDSAANAQASAVTLDIPQTDAWTQISCTLTAAATEDGALSIRFDGEGALAMDFMQLIPESSYGFGTEQWKNVTLRSDLYETLEQLNPAFIRFPGGCLCEGTQVDNLYNWKNTIGSLESRKQDFNLWRDDENGRQYINTNAMGYHEYFQLCSDLRAEPLPILNVGLTCQGRNGYDEKRALHESGQMTEAEWEAYLDTIALRPGTQEFEDYVQDIYDLIEYANGDAETTQWGAVRAQNGSKEPFGLHYIGLGNENWGDVYFRNFAALYDAVKEKYPEITVISSSGTWLGGDDYDAAWRLMNATYPDTVVDEHYYTGDDYLFEHNDRYDSFDRNGASVFVGEYAATSSGRGTIQTKSNIWAALEEAGYLTGLERNGDVVQMASYAPTFAKINAQCWNVNMIWFDSQQIVLTPSYYVQMLYANNTGSSYIKTELENGKTYTEDKIYTSVTADEDEQVLYVKLVNASGKAQTIDLDLSGYSVNTVSDQYISAQYKRACNELEKNYIVPAEQSLACTDNTVQVQTEKYSVHVLRIAYGENTGSGLYALPELPSITGTYIPQAVKIGVPCGIAGGVLLLASAAIVIKTIKKRKKKNDEG